MRAQPLRNVLLALVLVFGQWLNFAHASDHSALSPDSHACEFCVHAQGLLPGLADLPPTPTLCVVHEAPSPTGGDVFSAAAPSYYAIRGPPVFFV